MIDMGAQWKLHSHSPTMSKILGVQYVLYVFSRVSELRQYSLGMSGGEVDIK